MPSLFLSILYIHFGKNKSSVSFFKQPNIIKKSKYKSIIQQIQSKKNSLEGVPICTIYRMINPDAKPAKRGLKKQFPI